MKKLGSVILIFTLLFSLIPTMGEVAAKQNSSERVLVIFKDKVDKNLVSNAKAKIHREYSHISALAISVPTVALKGLENNPNVLAVEKDQLVQVKSQTQDWGIKRTDAPTAWQAGFTGKGVKIAVVDSGIASHEDLQISGGASFTSYTSSYSDDNGHGTHVAGIIGARNNTFGFVGMAYESNIYAVKVLDQNGSGYLSDVVAGIDWSITNKMDIINLSLGTTSHSSTLQQVVDKAYSQGILVVAAAGNNGTVDGSGDTVNYPARYDSVIAVAASDSNNNRASFSTTGSTIEVAAPGVNIFSTYLGNKYVSMSGTSMAAPYASGNLALLKQAHPTLTAAELRKKLQENVIDLGASGKDTWFGFGLIQAPKPTQTTPVEDTTSEPAQTVEQVKVSKTSVTTDKTSYLVGQKVSIKVQVVDQNGMALTGAAVNVTITPPKGKVVLGKGTTDQTGVVTFILSTSKTSPKGTYQVKADSSLTGYESSSATTSFQLK